MVYNSEINSMLFLCAFLSVPHGVYFHTSFETYKASGKIGHEKNIKKNKKTTLAPILMPRRERKQTDVGSTERKRIWKICRMQM